MTQVKELYMQAAPVALEEEVSLATAAAAEAVNHARSDCEARPHSDLTSLLWQILYVGLFQVKNIFAPPQASSSGYPSTAALSANAPAPAS